MKNKTATASGARPAQKVMTSCQHFTAFISITGKLLITNFHSFFFLICSSCQFTRKQKITSFDDLCHGNILTLTTTSECRKTGTRNLLTLENVSFKYETNG